jgi:hypothetical protein
MNPLHVFSRPGELFSKLPDRSRAWILPLLIDCLLGVALFAVEVHFIGFVEIVRQQMEAIHVNPENMAKALAAANTPARLYISYVQTLFFIVIAMLIISGVLTGFGMMTGKPPGFGAMLSMVTIAEFPYYLIVLVMTSLILAISPDPASLRVRNLIATNPAAYIDPNTTAKGLYSLLESVDILSFAELVLLAYGFSRVTRSSISAGLAAVIAMWILYVSCKMAVSSLF